MAEDISFIKEIDDALRADRMELFLRRYGKLVLGACIAIVVGTAASVYWKSHVRAYDEKQTGIVLDAKNLMESGQYAQAQKMLQSAGKSGKIASISKMLDAQAFQRAGEFDKAAKAYQALADDKDADQAIRDMAAINARVLASNHQLKDGSQQKLPDAWSRPFFTQAGELNALRLEKEGKHEEAVAALKKLADDPAVPPSQRKMAGDLLNMIQGEK